MDDGTFGYVLSSFGFNVETDVGINGCFAPFWLLGTRCLNSAAWFDKRWIWWYYSSVVASEYFSRRNVSVNGFVWSVAISTPSSLFLVSGFENSDLARFNSLFSAKFWLRIPIDDEILIRLFCHSLGSRLRLLLRLVKVVLEYGFRDTLLGTIRLAGLGMDLMVLFFFCDFFWGLGVLKRPETIVVWRHWFGRSLRPGKPSNSPRCVEGATMARRAPFPLSSIPAYIEQSMKLFVCLSDQYSVTVIQQAILVAL